GETPGAGETGGTSPQTGGETPLPDPPAPGEGHGTPREGTPDPADTGGSGGRGRRCWCR
ncbi:hypothetical protein GA0115257_10891, partial [Streptomyces sp. LcepLS]